jgi:hypothetical protein
LTMTPIPTKAGVSSESSPDVASSKDEWAPSSQETITEVDEISGAYPGTYCRVLPVQQQYSDFLNTYNSRS